MSHVTQIRVINPWGGAHSADGSKVQELFSQIRASVMEVPSFLQKEHSCNENNHCTTAIKDTCLVQLTKQVPPAHRSFWIASQKQAKAGNEAQSWEAPNCLTEHKTFLLFHPRYPCGATLAREHHGAKLGRGPRQRALRGAGGEAAQPISGVLSAAMPTHSQRFCLLCPPLRRPQLGAFQKSSCKKRKEVFKNKRDILWAPQSLPGSPHPHKKSPKHAERSFKDWITALGADGPSEAAFSLAVSCQHGL